VEVIRGARSSIVSGALGAFRSEVWVTTPSAIRQFVFLGGQPFIFFDGRSNKTSHPQENNRV
jgi:hypothetical protein